MSLLRFVRPCRNNGRPALPVPGALALMFTKAIWPTALVPTYATCPVSLDVRSRSTVTFQLWMDPRSRSLGYVVVPVPDGRSSLPELTSGGAIGGAIPRRSVVTGRYGLLVICGISYANTLGNELRKLI